MDAIAHDELFDELERQRRAGKILHYGVALGPAIGWRDEGLKALRERSIASVQTVYNMLERQPGEDFLAAARRSGGGILARVPTSSGLLEGKFSAETRFADDDHRRHRPASWLAEGLPRVERLRFLEHGGRTLTEAAIQFILNREGITSVLPTITTVAELDEYAAAAAAPALSRDELALADRALKAA
jgi:aryl-alcohol dehydrogenase-like predicted oxidoreductase